MTEILWNPGKAAQVGNLQGQMTGYIAGAYSLPGIANISAAPTEVLNQNGYTVYQDSDTGRYVLKYDNHTDNPSIWTSQSMGVTLDCTGDSVVLKGIEEQEEEKDGEKDAADPGNGGTTQSSYFGLTTSGTNFDYGGYTTTARDSFASSARNTLNRLSAAQSSGVSYASTQGLELDETIDPLTSSVIDKEKSAAIDEINTSETAKHKFDNIAKLIDKVAEKQSKAEVEAVDKSGSYALGAGVAAGAVGAGVGMKIGGAIGSFIPVPVVGTVVGAAVGAALGWAVGKAVKSHDESKADKVNNKAAEEAQKAGDELKEALEGLSEDELIAFQRYYSETRGYKVTDALKALETDEDSTEIAQGAGFDSGYLTGVFEKVDSANETLKPDEEDETQVASSNTKEISYSQAAQIEVLQQNANLYRQYWQAALKNGGSVEINGETKTADELSQLYIEANAKLEDYLNGLDKLEYTC